MVTSKGCPLIFWARMPRTLISPVLSRALQVCSVYCMAITAAMGLWPARLSYMSGGGPEWSMMMEAVSLSSTGNLAFRARTWSSTMRDIMAGRNWRTRGDSSLGSLKSCESIISQAPRPRANILRRSSRTGWSLARPSWVTQWFTSFIPEVERKLMANGSQRVMERSPNTWRDQQ